MNDWLNLFSGDLVMDRGDVSKALDRLDRLGYRFAPHPVYQNVIECLASPLDARLSAMKEFSHDPRSED